MTWQQKHIILLEIIFDQFLLTHPWLSVPAQSHAKVKINYTVKNVIKMVSFSR